jgi:Ankyrin repeats (3 copies)
MAETKDHPILFTLVGLNRTGRILYTSLFVLAVPALMVWTILMPRLRFHEQDEHLFKAARHGDVAGIARALAEGANVNAEAPIDRRTALFRSAAFGYADAVRALLKAGADPERRGNDGRTALQFAEDVRKEEQDPARAKAYDQVIAALREVQR